MHHPFLMVALLDGKVLRVVKSRRCVKQRGVKLCLARWLGFATRKWLKERFITGIVTYVTFLLNPPLPPLYIKIPYGKCIYR